MKKTIALSTVLAGSLLLCTQSVFAENKSSATTEGTISVTKPDAANPEDVVPVPPVDPNDPDTPFTPDEPNQGTSGLLTIDQAPDLDFGTIKLGTAKTVYAALQNGTDSTGTATQVQNFVQVTDKSGNYAGWKLSVKRTEFIGTTSDTNKLTGSKVKFKNAVIRNSATNSSGTPSTVSGTGAEGIEIPADQAVDLVTAGANEGIGTWIYSLGENVEQGRQSVELFVPVSNYAVDNYVSTFTWSLTDAPTEEESVKSYQRLQGVEPIQGQLPEICYAYVSALIHQLEAVFWKSWKRSFVFSKIFRPTSKESPLKNSNT